MKPIPDFENDPSLTGKQKKRRREYYAAREKNILKSAEWRKNNREWANRLFRESKARHKQQNVAYNREWGFKRRQEKPELFKAIRESRAFRLAHRRHRMKLKQQVIAAYGGRCECCNEDRIEFLSIDHIFGDGAERRKQGLDSAGIAFYRQLKKDGFPQGRLRVLCYNCNCARGYYGYCPHEVEAKRLLGLPVSLPELRGRKSALGAVA